PELLIVLVVVGVMSVVVVPHIEVFKYRMDGSVRGFTTALVMAQRSAVNRQHDVVVAFDTAQRRIRIHQDANNDGVVDAGERIRYVTLDEGVRFGLGSAPSLTAEASDAVNFTDAQDGLPAVRFHRNGSASTQGSFYLTSDRAIAGGYEKDTRAVEVARSTGRATWYTYDPPAWKQGF
ncbi:MAG TPA: GspH/FimT family protein, partial [Longimicrobiales bacterium]|nr:GspH/FimT family protein [Longimicrobiales bacterium]